MANVWYIHSGNGADGAQDGTSAHPYATIGAWHTAVNGGGFSTTGIGSGDVLVLASSEGNYFREGPQTFNFGGSTTKSLTVRAWQSTDPNPSGLTIQRPVIRGDVLLTSLTLDAGTGYYFSEQLPAGVTSVRQLLYKYDDPTRWTKEGFRTGHVTCSDQAADPTGGTVAAGTAIYQTTSRRIWINTTGLSTTAADFAYCAASYSTSGKSNAGICFQNCFNCSFDGLEVMAFYEPTAGWYGFSMENATNCTIRRCKTTDTSHHGVGFTGTSSPGNVNCLIEDCEIYGLGKSGAAFLMGNSAGNANCVARNNTAHLYPHLNVSGTALVTTVTISPFWLGSTGGGTMSGCLVENCRFIFYPGYLPTTSLPVAATCWTTSTPSDLNSPTSYPAVVRNCELLNMTGWVIDGATGTPPSQSLAFVGCVLDFTGFSNMTAGSNGNGVVNFTVGGSNNNAFLFQKCVLSANLPGINTYPNFFTCTNGAGSTTRITFTFDQSAVVWFGGKMHSNAYCGFFEFRAGASGSTGMKVVARNSVFSHQWAMHREAAAGNYGDRYMLAGNNSGATPGADFTFAGCGYFNFRDGFYCDGTTYDDWSEWSTVVDTTGVKFTMPPLVGLPYRAVVNPALPDSVKAQFSGLPNSPGVQAPTGVPLRGRGR